MRSNLTALVLAIVAVTSAAPAAASASLGAVSGTSEVDTLPALVVSAREMTGRHALLVEGNAPRNARITLTVLATIAPDLPAVLLQRTDVQADLNGRFATVVPLAPDYFTGSLVTLVATTAGTESAATHVVLDGAL